jgi:SAM-dependent methyltransferase
MNELLSIGHDTSGILSSQAPRADLGAGEQISSVSSVARWDFDESVYLAANPDVADAVAKGQQKSGRRHYILHGHVEGRPGAPLDIPSDIRAWLNPNPNPYPLPAPHLLSRVHGDQTTESFDAIGKGCVFDIEEALATAGGLLDGKQKVLDFGCGYGRIARWIKFMHPSIRLFGCDIDEESIVWLMDNMEQAGHFSCNSPLPPLPYPSKFFDVIISVSVFTHLPEDMQFAWLRELQRVAKVGATIALSVHGNHLAPADARTAGFHYQVAQGRVEGLPSFYQEAFHADAYIREKWSDTFRILDIIPRGVNNHQDLVICRRE